MALVGKPKPSTSLFGAPRLWDGVPPQLPVSVSLSSMGVHGPEARRLHRSNAAGWHQGMGRRPRGRTEWRPSTHCFPVVAAAAAAASGGEEAEERGKAVAASEAERSIPWSDEVVRWRRERSRWSTLDVATAGVVVSMHGLCLLGPFTFRWGALWTAVALYVVTGLLGITLSFHRNLAHRSFILPKWLEYTFAYCGVQALQGNPLDWVSTHRNHHQYCDSPRDPHSPIEGFWFSHVSWLFDSASVLRRCGRADNVGDLERQPFYRFIRRTYMAHPIALALILYVAGGLPYLVWGMGVRIVWVYHVTWLVNSACHLWGHQSWNTGDLSRNNWWVALLAFGEGWHNNHHAFEYSARHGLEWWEVDMTWYVVRLLQAVGLATHVRLPTAAHMRTMSLTTKVDAAFAAPHRRPDDTRSSLP